MAPIYHQGELVAWIGASGHQLDTGGMDPGGFSIKAVDMHQEGLRMPPVKLVEAGSVREDVLSLDHQPGARSAGRARRARPDRRAEHRPARGSLELIDAWGVDTVKAVMQRSIEHARDKLAERLAELPDGEWRDVQYIDHDGHAPEIYQIVCTMTKHGDRLAFDFAGTSPNARGLINST